MKVPFLLLFSLFFQTCVCEKMQIWDIWQTTWDRKNLFTSLAPRPPLNFAAIPAKSGSVSSDAIINVDDSDPFAYPELLGFGGTLTDSSALILNKLKSKNPKNYKNLLNYLFSAKEGADAAGFSYIRLPMGATDFSERPYSYNDVKNDVAMKNVDAGVTPAYVYTVLKDILAVNPAIKIHALPWSPPGWMKTSSTVRGGTLKSDMINLYPTYLIRGLLSLRKKGVNLYAVSVQNEPQYSNPTYPSALLTPANEAKIATQLRKLMNANGFDKVKLIGFEHNWSNATDYAVKLMKAAPDTTFDGVAFHCYNGSVSQQGQFSRLYPKKEVYFTECSGVMKTDWWNDIKWFVHNVFMGAIDNRARTALLWNIALDTSGGPKYPGTTSCGGPGCRGIVSVRTNGTWYVNQEFYSMAHLSKATIPRDIGGPAGRRIDVSVEGKAAWALRTAAFITGRNKTSDRSRYSLVVLNWNDNVGGWKPTPVKTTIRFRGMQVSYTFPVGITTLWWYATASDASAICDGASAESTGHSDEHFG